MATDAKFVALFISQAAARGEIALEAAKSEIVDIDKKIMEADTLKLRRKKLMDILDYFGDETYKRKRRSDLPFSDDVDLNSKEFFDLKDKIKNEIETNGPRTIRELIQAVGVYEQDYLIIRAVKNLGDLEIISRNEDKIQQGPNWNK
ncbi:MAG: hypothetical protein WC942_01430 [Clostridia bacterium]|jgi:hypothetical protein